MRAKSIRGNSAVEIQSALEQAATSGFKPCFAVIFISIYQQRQAVCDVLIRAGIEFIGATSSTEFIDGEQTNGGIVMLLFEIKKDSYRILFEDLGSRTLEEASTQLAQKAKELFEKPAFIICSTSFSADGIMLDGETLIRSFEKVTGNGVTLFGGMAGDDLSFKGTYVFTDEHSTDRGIVAWVLDENKISLEGIALSGWKPIGVIKTITKSKDNLLYEIDDQPALEVYLRYIGHETGQTEENIKFFESVGMFYPLQILRENRTPMMCTPIGYDKAENALVMESVVESGSKFRFSTPPDFDIIETIVESAETLKKNFQSTADAVLVFSCASRLNALGPMAQEEKEGLFKVWNAPMAGFYTYGEFGKGVDGKHEFHSTTCSWVAIREINT